jgi:hypothetical protein
MRRPPSLPAILLASLLAPGAAATLPLPALALPDLVVRQDMLGGQWVVRDENLSPTACSVIEGSVTPGLRRLLRFTVGVANVGDQAIHIGDPNEHVAQNDGLFEFAQCHAHYHFRNYAVYQLVDAATGQVWRSAKRGFCMLDTDPNPAHMGQAPRSPYYLSCGSTSIPGNQGISNGWTDTYRFDLAGQYFVLDAGDGQQPVPPGRYIIRVIANPAYTPDAQNPCRFPDGAFCHALQESDYTNNVAETIIDIPAHVGRSGVGPSAGTPVQEERPEH